MEASMRLTAKTIAARTAGAAFAGILLAAGLFAQDAGDDIHQVVARVSYLNGAVSYARGDDPDNWQTADVNVPLTLGDRMFTADNARAELQIQGGAAVRMSGNTDLAAMNLTDGTKQLSLTLGTAAFQIKRLGSDEVFEVDTPNAAITFDAIGDYRIDVDKDGNTRVAVRRGSAIVAAGGGQVTVNAGDEMDINGIDAPQYQVVGLAAADGFDRWLQGREDRSARSRSRQYVSDDVVGVADLDDYGKWQNVPEYGQVWAPATVEVGWAPYRVGHWVWQDPWGWTWVSGEPWGWAPYHSGRWIQSSARWFWVPDARRARVVYAPAMVAFVGGDPGAMGAGGFVGWFPLAPRDPFLPWWGRRAANVSVTNVTYVNRTYVTVVNQNTFISGGIVTSSVVTDRAIIQRVSAGPVLRGPLPFVPTPASLRMAVRTGLPAPPRPPALIVQRAVVARIAPPPAPPRFDAKLAVIRENHGAPVAADAAARIVASQGGGPSQVTAIRPVSAQPGRMTLAPAPGRDTAHRPAAGAEVKAVPIAPIRGRENATAQKPIVASVPAGGQPAPAAPIRGREVERPAASGPAAAAPAQPAQSQPSATSANANDQRNTDRRRVFATPAPSGGNPAAQNNQDRVRRNPLGQVTPGPSTGSGSNSAQQPPENPRRDRVVRPTPVPPQNGGTANQTESKDRAVPRPASQNPVVQPTREQVNRGGPPDRSPEREAPVRAQPAQESKPRGEVKEEKKEAPKPKAEKKDEKKKDDKKDEKKDHD
jgi:hypothetical protein